MERLDGYIAARTGMSRRDAKAAIKTGRVTVNSVAFRRADTKIDGEAVALDGRVLESRPYIYIMLNKPAGVLSAARDEHAQTVLDLLPPSLRRNGLFPVGRLDKDTTGLLLITNDGDTAHRLLSPSSHVPKTYEAVLDSPVTDDDIAAFAQGVELKTHSCLPAKLCSAGGFRARVTVFEGKYHQVKRMFAARGKSVLELCRTDFGGITLGNLPAGQARLLTEDELETLNVGH